MKHILTQKLKSRISILIFITSILIGCNRDNSPYKSINSEDLLAFVAISDSTELQKQLSYIAKGLAGAAEQDHGFKNAVQVIVRGTPFFEETHSILEDEMFTSYAFTYHFNVSDWINTLVPTNDYDSSYFFNIDYYNGLDTCKGKVVVRIPNADIVDTTALHVVTADNVASELNSATGYFMNGSALDSLTLTEDNIDSFYVWVVGVEITCWEQPAGYCGDSICQEELGETPEECDDCHYKKTYRVLKTGEPRFKLYLEKLHFKTDEKKGSNHPSVRYQEAFLQTKYEVRLPWLLIDDVLEKIVDAELLEGYVEEEFDDQGNYVGGEVHYTNVPRHIDDYRARDILRKNLNNNKTNNGSHFDKTFHDLLNDDYIPNHQTLGLAIGEFDGGAWYNQAAWGMSGAHVNWSYIAGQNSSNTSWILDDDPWDDAVLVVNSASDFWDPGYSGPWTQVGGGGPDPHIFEATFTLDGELWITLRIEEVL